MNIKNVNNCKMLCGLVKDCFSMNNNYVPNTGHPESIPKGTAIS